MRLGIKAGDTKFIFLYFNPKKDKIMTQRQLISPSKMWQEFKYTVATETKSKLHQ